MGQALSTVCYVAVWDGFYLKIALHFGVGGKEPLLLILVLKAEENNVHCRQHEMQHST